MVPVHAASTSPTSPHTTYGNSNNTQPGQPQYPAYYTSSNYLSGNNQQIHPNTGMPMNYAYHPQTVPPQSSIPPTTYQPHAHAYINPYPQSPSNPQTQVYGAPSGETEQPYTIREIPPQIIGLSSESPTSPGKPYSCDLCALSFNRQHDLKRHRETHTGEKPYLCNGGCGKTFTRKDALKRHKVCVVFKINGTIHSTYNVTPSSSKTVVKSIVRGANAKVLRYTPTPYQMMAFAHIVHASSFYFF